MIRQIAYLDKPQAKAVIQLFKRSQLQDLAVFLSIDSKNNKGPYKLCLDCPQDSHPRINAKIQDVADTLIDDDKQAILSIDDDAEILTEQIGMTPDYKEYVEEQERNQ
jgi:hypothetical protein